MTAAWTGFRSPLAHHIVLFLATKRALGCRFVAEDRNLRLLDRFLVEQMLMLGERALYHVIYEYLAYYHTERNHQGLDNRLIAPEGAVGCHTGHVVRRERLGGLLSYYHREAA